ncbi:PREDICTED: GPI-anchored protein LORELEI-like [Camelina sativa]|uniref:GPI-anchored protein LORELEI-like n=1 Tax=Camelina sativa TaxID=90675 RepID=A0ABM0TYF8_CAMSA|nr:PREDICTED: GPI-anchored protein LORELEI-like [Camelina sativa]
MEIAHQCLVSLLSILLLCGLALSLHISLDDLESHQATSRALLQAKATCQEDFATKNYTIITSKCKGPNYPAKICCSAFKDFACPFAEALNDEKTDCASTMFSYINLYGRYPPGIFANMCKEGKEGLDCTDVKPTASSSHALIPLVPRLALLITIFILFCIF